MYNDSGQFYIQNMVIHAALILVYIAYFQKCANVFLFLFLFLLIREKYLHGLSDYLNMLITGLIQPFRVVEHGHYHVILHCIIW